MSQPLTPVQTTVLTVLAPQTPVVKPNCKHSWSPAVGSKISDCTMEPHSKNKIEFITDAITAMAAQLETNSIVASVQKGHAAKKIQNNAQFDEFAQLQGKHPLDAYTLESVQERDANGKLLLEHTFDEYASDPQGYVQQSQAAWAWVYVEDIFNIL
jgi:hypothetical protein